MIPPPEIPQIAREADINEPVAGLAITYRVTVNGNDMDVAFRSPYGALMFAREVAASAPPPAIYKIVDDFSPPGRRVTPTVITTDFGDRIGYQPVLPVALWPDLNHGVGCY